MDLVTLISDFGSSNYLVASLKGKLLGRCPDLKIIDITHDVANFDIAEAAWVIENVAGSFSEGTIHIILVNCYYSSRMRLLTAVKNGSYFIAPDNGVLSLITEDCDLNDFVYSEYSDSSIAMFDIISSLIQMIINGNALADLGKPLTSISRKLSFKPVISNDTIRATVLHIDKFGNIIVNVKKELFDKISYGRKFSIFFSPKDKINKLYQKYSDAGFGDEMCLFNSAGYLEIAVYMGNASELLGIYKDSPVHIVFE
ncbi:MAG: S-adenosyl-l-methionine hydroxide adenosyltransferase family protein [Deltaproteobacteria bacterium]